MIAKLDVRAVRKDDGAKRNNIGIINEKKMPIDHVSR